MMGPIMITGRRHAIIPRDRAPVIMARRRAIIRRSPVITGRPKEIIRRRLSPVIMGRRKAHRRRDIMARRQAPILLRLRPIIGAAMTGITGRRLVMTIAERDPSRPGCAPLRT